MKCLCGYEYKYEVRNDVPVAIIGDKPFIKLRFEEYSLNAFDKVSVHPKVNGSIKYILACPKCGTLKIDL